MTGDTSAAATAVRDDDGLLSLADAFGDDEVGDERPPRRRRTLRNALIGVVVCLVVIALMAVTVVTVVGMKLSSNLDRIPGVFDGLTNRPDKPASGPGSEALNILVLGTDRRSEVATTGSAADAPSWVPGAQRTDAIMILHIDGDREAASLISIPRDSWVVVPGYGMSKVNAAFSYGGPTLAVQTVELLTGVRIDHLAVTDWDGFSGLIDALGGVTVKIPETVTDSMHDVTWPAGKHELDGAEALEYVGQRYGLPLGDLDRVRRQQAVFRALATETLRQDPMGDPRDTYGLLNTMTRHLSVDDTWSARDMAATLMSLRGMRGSSIDYLTAPVAGFGSINGQSIVRLDRKTNQSLWGAVVTDDVEDWSEHHPSDVTPRVVR